MAQHDYSVANATGLNFRTDLNNALQAIATTNSGAAAPTTTFPGMLWLDMSGGGDGVVKRRNAANTAWLTDLGLDQTARDMADAAMDLAEDALPKTGGTMTGPIDLPDVAPTGHQAVSRAQADALYQIKLPAAAAGALLIGQAGGWTNILTAGASNNVLSISGGVPVWASTTQTALPNTLVRTGEDGTIDPSFIPSVASGLRFSGTFKPTVNDEYPAAGDNGHGPGGAPVVGDFWVIDGLTTGGYTYLTGSLAGITVYNGDSIAFDGVAWYRMGSSVSLQGYLKTDGTNAMGAALNMGNFPIANAGGLHGRAGSPVPQTNFRIDATNVVIHPQRAFGVAQPNLAVLAAGQIGSDLGRAQIYVGTGAANQAMVAVPYHSTQSDYQTNEYVKNAILGLLYRAKGNVSAGVFTASQWAAVMDVAGATMEGHIIFKAGANTQWMNAGQTVVGYTIGVTGSGATETLQITPHNDAGAALGTPIIQWRRSDNLTTVQSLQANAVTATNINTNFGGVQGYSALRQAASGTQPGYAAFYDGDDVRWGFIGTSAAPDTNNIQIFADGAHGWTIDGNNVQVRCDITHHGRTFQVSQGGAATIVWSTVAGTHRYYNTFDDFRFNWSIYTDAGVHQATPLQIVRKWATGSHVLTYGVVVVGDLNVVTAATTGVIDFGSNLTGRLNFSGTQFVFSHACTGPAFTPTSDAKVKNELTHCEPRSFDALPFYSFRWKDSNEPDRGTTAQDVEKIAPEYVTKADIKGLNVAALALEVALNVARRVARIEHLLEAQR